MDKTPPAPRSFVRQGSKNWLVYDRQRKGPALIGTNPAVDLPKERAEQLPRRLGAGWEGTRGPSDGPAPFFPPSLVHCFPSTILKFDRRQLAMPSRMIPRTR